MAYSDESPDGPQPIVGPRHEHAARPDRDRAGARVMLKLSRACDDSNAKIPFKSKAPRFFLMAIPAMFRFGSPAGMNLIQYLNLYCEASSLHLTARVHLFFPHRAVVAGGVGHQWLGSCLRGYA